MINNISRNSVYPSERQRAAYSEVEYTETAFQKATNASAFFFRRNYKLVMYAYIVLATLSCLEFFSNTMSLGVYSNEFQYGSLKNTSLTMVLSATFAFSHYYIYMIFGHGYQSQEAQFYADKYSSLQECKSSISLMRGFYTFSILTALGTLAVSWFTADSGWLEQVVAVKNYFESNYYNVAMYEYGLEDMSLYSNTLVAYSWTVTIVLVTILILSVIGLVQSLLAPVR